MPSPLLSPLPSPLPSRASLAAPTARYQEKREAIVCAAAVLFNERGVKGTTLADIAAAVGLLTNSVTYYYRKKEDLATACFLRSIEAFNSMASQAAQQTSVADRLQVFFALHAQLLAGIDRGERAPLVSFSDIRALPSSQLEQVFAAYTEMFRRVRDLLKGPQTQQLSRDDFNARGHIIISNVHWVRVWIGRYEVDEYTRVAERVVDFMLRGLPANGELWQAYDGESCSTLAGSTNIDSEGARLEAFLRAATVLVNEQGYRGASVDKISARLNVTKGSFYHHNDNKHDLITECFERSFAVVRRALALAADSSGSGWARACEVSRALARYQLSDHGPLLRFTATSALPDEEHRARVRTTMNRLTERLGNVVVDGLMDGSIRPLDATIAAQSITASINAAAELHRWLPGVGPDDVASVYVRPLLEGVLCPPASRD